jgi:hypothetical protein
MNLYPNPDELTVGYIVMVSSFSIEFLLAYFLETFLAPYYIQKDSKESTF